MMARIEAKGRGSNGMVHWIGAAWASCQSYQSCYKSGSYQFFLFSTRPFQTLLWVTCSSFASPLVSSFFQWYTSSLVTYFHICLHFFLFSWKCKKCLLYGIAPLFPGAASHPSQSGFSYFLYDWLGILSLSHTLHSSCCVLSQSSSLVSTC